MRNAEFRLGPAYRLIAFGRCDPEVEKALAALRRDPDAYGILQPTREGVGTVRVIDKEAALLLLTLAERGPLPSFVLAADDGARWHSQIAAWVADSVLEIADGERFVSGPTALAQLLTPARRECDGSTLTELSRQAVRYAAALDLTRIETLADRLYAFHRLPLTPHWQRRLADEVSVGKFLGLREDPARLLPGWNLASRKNASDWLAWSRSEGEGLRPSAEPTWKLYLSPAMESVAEALSVLLRELPASRARFYKVGADAAGLLRPDKIVVYFDDLESLNETATRLASSLAGMPAHGVPLTAEVAGEGLLSWGIDPPRSERFLPWQVEESWRLWVARRLAAALIVARHQPCDDLPAWRFALERLRLEGVDVDRWVPDPTLWRRAG